MGISLFSQEGDGSCKSVSSLPASLGESSVWKDWFSARIVKGLSSAWFDAVDQQSTLSGARTKDRPSFLGIDDGRSSGSRRPTLSSARNEGSWSCNWADSNWS